MKQVKQFIVCAIIVNVSISCQFNEAVQANDNTSFSQASIAKDISPEEFQKLIDRPKEAYLKEMYRVNSTFGITVPVNHDRVRSFINGEINNMDWYQEHGHLDIAMAIPGYIVGYCLFYYSVPEPVQELLHLYYQIIYADYFKALGFSPLLFQKESTTFAEKAIKIKIKKIVDKYEDKFPRLDPKFKHLKYTTIDAFAKSYLLMIRDLDMTKSD